MNNESEIMAIAIDFGEEVSGNTFVLYRIERIAGKSMLETISAALEAADKAVEGWADQEGDAPVDSFVTEGLKNAGITAELCQYVLQCYDPDGTVLLPE